MCDLCWVACNLSNAFLVRVIRFQNKIYSNAVFHKSNKFQANICWFIHPHMLVLNLHNSYETTWLLLKKMQHKKIILKSYNARYKALLKFFTISTIYHLRIGIKPPC